MSAAAPRHAVRGGDLGAALRIVRWIALAGAALTLVVVASSSWLRQAQSGLRCPDRAACYGASAQPGTAGRPAAPSAPFIRIGIAAGSDEDVARLAHRASASLVSVAALGVLLVGWTRRDMPRGVVVTGRWLVAVTVLLAAIGTSAMELRWPIVTVANLVGGMLMLALFVRAGGLAFPPSAPAGVPTTARRARHHAAAGIWRWIAAAAWVQVLAGAAAAALYGGLACGDELSCLGAIGASPPDLRALDPLREAIAHSARDDAGRAALAWLDLLHRLLAIGMIVLVVLALRQSVRPAAPATRAGAVALVALAAVQSAIGAVLAAFALPFIAAWLHNLVAASMLATIAWIRARQRIDSPEQ